MKKVVAFVCFMLALSVRVNAADDDFAKLNAKLDTSVQETTPVKNQASRQQSQQQDGATAAASDAPAPIRSRNRQPSNFGDANQ